MLNHDWMHNLLLIRFINVRKNKLFANMATDVFYCLYKEANGCSVKQAYGCESHLCPAYQQNLLEIRRLRKLSAQKPETTLRLSKDGLTSKE